MNDVSEKTKIKIYDVVNSLPTFITIIVSASFIYFQGNANSKDIEDLKTDRKIILEKLNEIKLEIEKLKK